VRLLLPPPVQDDVDDETLTELYAYPADRPWVRANMVSSLDGAVTGPDARSGSLATAADRRVFSVLRALCDVVLVGAGTARAEGYGPARVTPDRAALRARLGLREAPTIAVVSGSLDLDPSAPLFTEAHEPTLVLTHAGSPTDRQDALTLVADVGVVGENHVDVRAALSALHGRGLTRVLCEGGPHLLADVAAAGALDELCLTVAPVLEGGTAPRILTGPPLDLPMQLGHVLEEEGTLLTRWVRN